MACAVARASLRVLMEENMIENAALMGDYLLKGLQKIRSNLIREVRGRGLMVAIEFHENAGGARQYSEKLRDVGILCKETHENTLRFAPPLIIKREEIDWMLERIERVLTGKL